MCCNHAGLTLEETGGESSAVAARYCSCGLVFLVMVPCFQRAGAGTSAILSPYVLYCVKMVTEILMFIFKVFLTIFYHKFQFIILLFIVLPNLKESFIYFIIANSTWQPFLYWPHSSGQRISTFSLGVVG